MAAPVRNWDEIRTYYITHNESLGQVADIFGITRKAIEKKSSAEKWSTQRKLANEDVAKVACAIVMEHEAENVAEQLITASKSATTLADRLMTLLSDDKVFYRRQVVLRNRDGSTEAVETVSDQPDMRAARDAAQAVRDLTTTIRNLYGIPTLPEKAAMELSKARLNLEQKKYEDSKEDEKPAEVVVRFMNAEPQEEAEGEA